jgi:pectinesterase
MGRIKYFLVLLLCVLSLSAYKKNEKITIFMIGDSTMANKKIDGGNPERGWGILVVERWSEDGE